MKDETLDDIESEFEENEKLKAADKTELIEQQEKTEEQKRFEVAMAKGYQVMAMMCGGINNIYPFVEFGESEKEVCLFVETGAEKLAHVIKKYETPELPEWFKRWQEEINAGVFFGSMFFSIYAQIKQHNKREEEKENSKDAKKSE